MTRQRHVRRRSTHYTPRTPESPEVLGLPMSLARDGEQSQGPDLAPRVIQTDHFDTSAQAPQVNNAPLAPDTATVTIDEEGLHVEDGAIFINDQGGNSVLNAAGFAGSWLDFITSGLYNATFAAGVGNGVAQPASTEVTQDGDLPYWEIFRAPGVSTSEGKVYHLSRSGSAYLMQASLWANSLVVGEYIQISQMIDVSGVTAMRYDGGFSVSMPYSVQQSNAQYDIELRVQPYGYDENPTKEAVGSLFSVSESLNLDPIPKELRVNVDEVHPFASALLIQIRLKRTAVGTAGQAQVDLFSVQIEASTPALMVNSSGQNYDVGMARLEATAASAGSGQDLLITPDVKAVTPLTGGVKVAGYVASTGGPLLRYVPIDAPYFVNGVTTAAAIAWSNIELTDVPANFAVAISGIIICSATIPGSGVSYRVANYSATAGQGQGAIVYPQVAGILNSAPFTVECGGTNQRQIKYTLIIAGGSTTRYLMVTGYWTPF